MKWLGRMSLAGRLYVRLFLLTAATGVLMAGLLLAAARDDINDRADRQLVVATNVLLLLMREELDRDRLRPTPGRDAANETLLSDEDINAFRASSRWLRFAVFHDGILSMPPAPPVAAGSIAATPGFRTFRIGRETWRSYGLAVPRHKLLIVVAEPTRKRGVLIAQVAERLLIPIAILIVGGAVLLWLVLRDGLFAVKQLSTALNDRSAADLNPLDLRPYPADLAPIAAALNRLLERVKVAVEHEQAFADHAAHQLRTPLAALKVRAQLMLRRATPDSEEHAALTDLLASLDRASETITQMLQLARLDASTLAREPVDLRDLVGGIIADRAHLAARSGVEFSLTAPESAIVLVDPAPLQAALAAIVDNAVEHASGGGVVDLEIRRVAGGFGIAVCDRGPGIAAARRTALAQDAAGAGPGMAGGLGLTIARRAMSVLGGALRLEARADGPGLCAIILFPD